MNISGIRMKSKLITIRLFMISIAIVIVLSANGVAIGSSGEGHEETGAKGWIATDTYRIINFAVLAIALFFLLRKPASQALGARIKGIKDQLEELEERKKDAEKELAEYNEKLSLLDQEAGKIVQSYIRQGNEAKARILEEAKLAAQKLEEQAKRNIEHEFKQSKLKLQKDILEKSLLKAEEIIKDKITTEDQKKLINEYLEKVVA